MAYWKIKEAMEALKASKERLKKGAEALGNATATLIQSQESLARAAERLARVAEKLANTREYANKLKAEYPYVDLGGWTVFFIRLQLKGYDTLTVVDNKSFERFEKVGFLCETRSFHPETRTPDLSPLDKEILAQALGATKNTNRKEQLN